MKIFLVGGAVRDTLLGLEVKDRDYVVIGSTPEEMLSLGYKQVGADFPVFLCPKGEEYALARTERKTGNGYAGFEVDASPVVTLKEDLSRRDLTINSMAMDLETSEIIDYFYGQEDLQNRVLRHTTEAFAEDPLRVLRVARFAARYNFRIAGETRVLMRDLVASGELNHLTNERVWVETTKALSENNAAVYFMYLHQVGAHKVLFPELNLKDVSALVNACHHNESNVIRYGCLFTSVPNGKEVSIRLKAPNEFITIAKHVSVNFPMFLKFPEMKAEEVLKFLESMDYLRSPTKVMNFLRVCELQSNKMNISSSIKTIILAISGISADNFRLQGLAGKQIGVALRNLRLEVITAIIGETK